MVSGAYKADGLRQLERERMFLSAVLFLNLLYLYLAGAPEIPPPTRDVAEASLSTPNPTIPWGQESGGLRLAVLLPVQTIRSGSALFYDVELGNFSDKTIWFDHYSSVKAAVDGTQVLDISGSPVPRNVSKMEVFPGGGPSMGSALAAGRVVDIVHEELSDHWQLEPGTYTLVVTLNIGPPRGPQVATVTARAKFTVTS